MIENIPNTMVQQATAVGEPLHSQALELTYEQGRWSTTREKNVDFIKEKWDDSPNLVLVLADPKLKGTDLAIVRNDHLQRMQKLVRDLVSGEAQVVHNIEIMLNAVSIIQARLRELDQGDGVLQNALRIATAEAKILSQICMRIPKANIEPAPISEEDRAALAEIEAE